MKVNVRLIVAAAAGAFVIAALSAGLAGVPFGVVLGRAVLSALIFAALGVGVSLVISRFLPELEEEVGEESAEHGVDIVIDDDDSEAPEGMSGSDDSRPSDEEEGIVDELEESSVPLDQSEEINASDDGSENTDGAAKTDVIEDVDEDTMDRLPDLGGFSSAFEGDDGAAQVDNSDWSEDSGAGGGEDPKLIARALQTMLKRDEEKG